MRSVSSSIVTAITAQSSAKMLVRTVVQPAYTSFSSLYSDYPFDANDYSVITDEPQPQCVISDSSNTVTTFVINKSTGAVSAMELGSASVHSLGLTATVPSRPGAYNLGNGSAHLYYHKSTGELRRVTVDLTAWTTSNAVDFELVPEDWTVSKAAIHPLNTNEFVVVYLTSKGGLGIAYYDGVSMQRCPLRIMTPTAVMNGYWTVHTAVVRFQEKIWVYASDLSTGEVRCISYDPYRYSWSDPFVAVQADMSRFCLTNAIIANGYIHLAGQFHRTEDLVDSQKYSLVLRSLDGKTFAWDKYTLLSTLAYQFHIVITSDKLYASDRNSIGRSDLSCFFTENPLTQITLGPPSDIISFSSGSIEQATIQLKAGDESYFNHAVVKKNNRALVYLGYASTSGIEYTLYMPYYISAVEEGYADGMRTLTLQLMAEGMWKSEQIAFPFYAEIQSKPTSYDDCDELDKTYTAPSTAKETSTLVLDFWGNEGWDGGGITTCEAKAFRTKSGRGATHKTTSGNTTYGFRTSDLSETTRIVTYPEINGTSVTINYYGWCRTEASGRANDTVTMYIVTIDDTGSETEHSGTLDSTYSKFPRYYPSTQSGSYPIIYTFSGLTAGHRIKYVCIKIENADTTSETISSPERLEVTGVSFERSSLNGSLTWKQTRPSSYSESDNTILEVPGIGIPYVLFTVKPYSAFNFNICADFTHEVGTTPFPGTVGWGVVGIAKDGANYIAARYNIRSTKFDILLMRSGKETLLASTQWTEAEHPDGIMLDHRGGLLRVYYKTHDGFEWQGPAISYNWNDANGAMSNSTSDIMHMGLYGIIKPPGFAITGFNVKDADGIPFLPGEDTEAFGLFSPHGGKVLIDNVIYTYGSKTGMAREYGPHHGRNTNNYDGTPAVEIAHYLPNATSNHVHDYLFSLAAHCWTVDSTDWTVTHYNAGTPNPLRNRCRHYCENANGDYVGSNTKCFVGPGLTDIESDSANKNTYLHPEGSMCFMYGTDRIWLKNWTATAVDADVTIKDILTKLSYTASVNVEFPNDYSLASLAISGTPTEIDSTSMHYTGGYDVKFRIPPLSGSQWIGLYGGNMYIGSASNKLTIKIANAGGYLSFKSEPDTGSAGKITFESKIPSHLTHDVRIVFHDLYCSVYVEATWVATFAYPDNSIIWPPVNSVSLYMVASESLTVSNILISELFDWREAIWIESELSAGNAFGSVIQERPIEIYPTTNGGLSFSYNLRRDTITYNATVSKKIIRKHRRTHSTSGASGSDAIVYSYDVGFVNNIAFANSEGFMTRVLKLSNLDTGAITAGRIMLEKALEKEKTHQLELRPDIRIEPGDILDFTYTLSGTGTSINYSIIIEGISLGIRDGELIMNVQGREDI